ncbi:hypothetical protein ACC703_13030 [Rhizobium ruizarguesonis]
MGHDTRPIISKVYYACAETQTMWDFYHSLRAHPSAEKQTR